MRRVSVVVLAGVLAVALAGCSGTSGGSQSGGVVVGGESDQGAQQVVSAATPDEMIAAMQSDCNDTAQRLYDSQADLFATVGDTFEGYNANIDAVKQWYASTVSETEALGERMLENSKVYFQAVVDTVAPDDREALSDAIDTYYDAIYDDAYGDYYDAVYSDLYHDIYERFYSGVISDAFDTEEYSKVSEAMSGECENYSDSMSGVYNAISDARSEIYDVGSDAWSAFYDNEFTLENIFREPVVNVEKTEG